jgi:hypothetical protein
MEQFEHIKPLLVFEVITHENKILHINSLSYETNGNYVTFYRAIVENKRENKTDENNKEIIKKTKRKIPFLTLKDVKKISLINFESDFELITEVGELYTEHQIETNNIKSELSSFVDTNTITNETKNRSLNESKRKIKSSFSVSNTHNNNMYSDDIVDTSKEYNDDLDIQQTNINNDDITSSINTSSSIQSDDELYDLMADISQDNNNNIVMDIMNNDNNSDMSDDEILSILSMENDDNNTENKNQVSINETTSNYDNDEILSDEYLLDMLNEVNSVENEETNNKDKQDNSNNLSTIKSSSKRNPNAENVINTILKRIDEVDPTNSQQEKEFKDTKKQLIKEQLDIYLQKTTTHFRSAAFYNFIQDKFGSNSKISEEEIINQICNMLKNKELNYQKFFNPEIQNVIEKNKDSIRHHYDGDLHQMLNILQRRNDETRNITMIDLVVYLRINNHF